MAGTKNPFETTVAFLGSSTAGDQLLQATQQLQQIYTTNETLIEATNANTQAMKGSGAVSGSGTSGDSTLGTIGKTLESVFGLGLGLSPLISGIASLFGGGGDASQPPPLVKFTLPPVVQEQAGVSEGAPTSSFAVDYGAGGLGRPSAPSPQITVQVQAMDSQSFLDRSNDIALAVRQAMLESGVLNDVIRGA
jgi:hypothetical protein